MYDEHRPRSRERESRRHDSPRRWPDRDDDRSWKDRSANIYRRSRSRSPGRPDLDAPGPRDRRLPPRAGDLGPDSAPPYDDEDSARYDDRHAPAPRVDPRPGSVKTLILEGLPDDATEKDVLYGLEIIAESPSFETDMLRAVRIRYNRKGVRIAFVEFYRAEDAADFLEHHPTSISLPLTDSRGIHSEPVTVGITFGRDREEIDRKELRTADDGWNCHECGGFNYPYRTQCYRCRTERPEEEETSEPSGPVLTGETDECPQQMPSQYLVVRSLDASTDEEALTQGISKLFVEKPSQNKDNGPRPATKLKSTAPTGDTSGLGAKPGTLRRVFLMRDRRTNESWKYGFAEFATLEDAQGAMAKFRALKSFTIGSKAVVVGFIHTGVFVPALDAVTSETAYTVFSPVYNPDIFLKYWDDRGYPNVHDVFVPPVTDSTSPAPPGKAGKPGEAAVQSAQDGGKKAKKPKDKTLVMAPQMQMWAKKRAELHGLPQSGMQSGGDGPSVPGERPGTGPRAAHWRDTYVSYADWDNLHCLLCDKTLETTQGLRDHEILAEDHATNLNDETKKEDAIASLAELDKQPQSMIRRRPRDRTDPAPNYISYADPDKQLCLICQRKFKNMVTLRLHERESELHRKNMTNEKNSDRAIAELAKLGRHPTRMQPVPRDRAKMRYRDRARERRHAFQQPIKPGASVKRRKLDKGTPRKEAPPPKKAVPSKGASLLNKMGWTAGQGLGAEGTGVTEAIKTELYAPGVGLGAEGGKMGDAVEEAEKKTQGKYSDFVEKTRDKARARYERLS